MAENRRRHPREYVNEPATIQVGGETYQGTITNISESGAAVEFVMGKGEDSVGFDIASRIEIDSETLGHLTGGDDGQVGSGMTKPYSDRAALLTTSVAAYVAAAICCAPANISRLAICPPATPT